MDKRLGDFFDNISSNNIGAVTKGLDSGIDVNVSTPLGIPLIWAIKKNRPEIAKLLIERGADINKIGVFGDTPLLTAIKEYNLDNIKLLLQKGADPNFFNRNGESALTLAINSNNVDLINLLLQNGANINVEEPISHNTPIFSAKNPTMAQFLLSKGANLNQKNTSLKTPLFYAVANNNLDLVNFFIQNGADVNSVDSIGNIPLVYAKNVEMAKLLVDNGADYNFILKNGKSVLDTFFNKNRAIYDYLTNYLYPDPPPGQTIWQYYCDQLGDLKVPELKALAKDAGITGYSSMTKPQLCQILNDSYKTFTKTDSQKIKNDINCEQNAGRSLHYEDFNEINPNLIIRDNQGFCHYLPELEDLFRYGHTHPFTRENLDNVFVGDRPIREVATERRKLANVHVKG